MTATRRRFVRALSVAVLLALPATTLACLWDHDTLAMERARFPTALELITGKFLRHSPEFYEWRIRDRTTKLESEPKRLEWYDDLAVAYDKTGQHDKAIATMLQKEKVAPGKYETYANLGTFYIMTGELEKSAEAIDRALAINPDAHFGREKYQKVLVQYAISRRKNGKQPLPLRSAEDGSNPEIGFASYLAASAGEKRLSQAEKAAAIKGVLGMMKFGYHDHPVLLEALGDLLLYPFYLADQNAKLLATRAYLKASYECKDEAEKTGYRQRAEQAIQLQTPTYSERQMKLDELVPTFQAELSEAKAWYEVLHRNEVNWIQTSPDPEAEFDKLYDREPTVSGSVGPDSDQWWWWHRHPEAYFAVGGLTSVVCLLAVCVIFVLVRRLRAKPGVTR